MGYQDAPKSENQEVRRRLEVDSPDYPDQHVSRREVEGPTLRSSAATTYQRPRWSIRIVRFGVHLHKFVKQAPARALLQRRGTTARFGQLLNAPNPRANVLSDHAQAIANSSQDYHRMDYKRVQPDSNGRPTA